MSQLARNLLMVFFLLSGGGCPTSRPHLELGAQVREVTETQRLPAAEKVFDTLQRIYVQPQRLRLPVLLRSAASLLSNFPELDVELDEKSGFVMLTSGGEARKVSCPLAGPLWSYKSCARRLAHAATELITDLDGQQLDRVFSQSLLDGLDPHTILLWNEADLCYFSSEGCAEPEVGVGLRFGSNGDRLVVLSVISDGPASRAGILPGDLLLSLDGMPADDLEPIEAEWLLRGVAGSKITLFMERNRDGKPYAETMIREELGKTKMFAGKKMGRIAYLRLSGFVPGVADEMKSWLNKARNLRGIVLDLRDNPGGLVREALQIADLFIDRGAVLVVKSRDGREKLGLAASSCGTAPRVSMVVLVNGRSVSASEMLAGTLQDNERALIVGQRTFGKGSMQVPVEVPGGILLVTVRRYYTGKGRDIQGKGVVPDVELRPVRARRDRLRWRHWPVPHREADISTALSASRKEPGEDSAEVFRYLEESKGEKSERAVALAVEFVKHIPWLGKLRPRSASARVGLRKVEDQKIRVALARIDIEDAGPKKDKLSFTVEFADQEAIAGELARVRVGVRNTGVVAIQGLSCHLVTENQHLSEREIAFPSLMPGQSQERTIDIHIPSTAVARADPVRLVWHGPGGGLLVRPQKQQPVFFRIERPAPARLGLDLTFEAIAPSAVKTAGDPVRLRVKIKNFGHRPSPVGFVSIDSRSGSVSSWNDKVCPLKSLEPGHSGSCCFTGMASRKTGSNKASLTVRFSDQKGRILSVRRFQLLTGGKPKGVNVKSEAHSPDWSPSVLVKAAGLVVAADTIDLNIRAWSNGDSLRDLIIYVEGKKSFYHRLNKAAAELTATVPIPLGSSLIQVVARKHSRMVAEQSLRVLRTLSPIRH